MINNFVCEICGESRFFEYNYPVYVAPLKRKIFWGAMRRYIVNPVKFIARIFFLILPKSFLSKWRKRARDPYKRIQSFREVFSTIKKIDQATLLFKDRRIVVCKKCDLGTVYPRISESELINYYKKDYWVANMGELEPAESPRTIITHKLLKEYLGFGSVETVVEFGSASAHLSRYIKTKEPTVLFDAVDPGILWKNVLKKEIRDVYNDLEEIKTKYDLLISSHALEHVSSIEIYFNKFKNVLNPGSHLYFEIPNSEERDLIFRNKADYHIPHTYFFTQKSFENIARKFGFEIVFNKTFSRSYKEIFSNENKNVSSMEENPKGTYLRVLLKKM